MNGTRQAVISKALQRHAPVGNDRHCRLTPHGAHFVPLQLWKLTAAAKPFPRRYASGRPTGAWHDSRTSKC